jgi:hypothetical protein
MKKTEKADLDSQTGWLTFGFIPFIYKIRGTKRLDSVGLGSDFLVRCFMRV